MSPLSRLTRTILPIRRAEDARFLFLIGAMKAGTTSLHNALVAHPAIHAGLEKEPNFFAHERGGPADMAAYLRLWPRGCWRNPEAGWLLDSSVSYSKYPAFGDAAAAIAAATRHRRILYAMRDPATRIESQIRHIVRRNPEAAEKLMPMCLQPGRMKQAFIDASNYALQINRYRQQFGREAIHLLTFEDLIAEPDTTLARIWAFLGLPAVPANLGHRNSTAAQTAAEAGPLLSLSPEVRAWLHEIFTPEMRRLNADYDVDVSRWGY